MEERAPVDELGFPIFSRGALGAAHVFVHRWVDRGELAPAARTLGRFLRDHPAGGSASVHLHWHMLVLDLDMGHVARSRARLMEHVMPFVSEGAARTDAPSALWLLALESGRPDTLPWAPVVHVARAHLHERDPFVAIHDALALAGGRAVDALDAWIEHRAMQEGSALLRLGHALRAHAVGDRARAARLLSGGVDLAHIGGSRAQRSLFERIARAHGAEGEPGSGAPQKKKGTDPLAIDRHSARCEPRRGHGRCR